MTDGAAFYALVDASVWSSTDGQAWTEIGDIGARVDRGAYGDGIFVAVTGGGSVPRFFRSEDARTWEEASFTTSLGGLYVRDFTAGWARSPRCP
jgi:hypothetical protein